MTQHQNLDVLGGVGAGEQCEPARDAGTAQHQRAHRRMQPVGADHQVEPSGRAAFEPQLRVVGYGRDGAAEDVLDVVAGGGVQDLAHVVPHDLNMAAGDGAHQPPDVDGDRTAGALAPHRDAFGAGAALGHRVEQAGASADLCEQDGSAADAKYSVTTECSELVRRPRPGSAGDIVRVSDGESRVYLLASEFDMASPPRSMCATTT